MASTSIAAMSTEEVDEQRRQLDRIEQERTDRELAQRLYQEQFETPPGSPQNQPSTSHYRLPTPPIPSNSRRRQVGSNQQPRAMNPSRRTPTSSADRPARRTTSRGGRASRGERGGARRGSTSAATTSTRRGTTTRQRGTSNRGAATPARGRRGRPRTATANISGPQLRFNGDQLELQNGGQLINVTGQAWMPDSDEDSDFEIGDDVDDEIEDEVDDRMDGVEEEEDSDIEIIGTIEPEDRRRRRNQPASSATARRRANQPTSSATARRRQNQPSTSSAVRRVVNQPAAARRRVNQPAISADYIRSLLNPNLMRDDPRTDPLYRAGRVVPPNDDEEERDWSDLEDVMGDLDDEDGLSLSDDDDDDDLVVDGPIRVARNNIAQPIFQEDAGFYNRELDLWHNDDEFRVPPANIPKQKNGKPVEPDPTWGDCTLCSNPPIKPQGCRKCLQFLGCAHCVRRWHGARASSYERPNCPLCRAEWSCHASGTSMMATIEKNRLKKKEKEKKKAASTSAAGTSTSSV
ncbi:hypothetical protein L5515_000890 [Caenorhabditis briggsae]|uniref:RING-type domain-containing protein n=1 Tax=Caenorhabditis briggsae TaxID=6238 RepID=A0AAE9DZP9_CAEBR|nr:hypothetical protein L5515_000890 [Caenorhabditis briggsae]